MRCVHEASLHDDNSFITLTYSPEFLPARGSLVLRDFQLFMKSLRKGLGKKIRFFMCGEYGEGFGRPHFHAIIFGHLFDRVRVIATNARGESVFESNELSKYWKNGMSSTGDVSFETAAYVARYVVKKVTGKRAASHYGEFVDENGEVFFNRVPEFTTMSRRPGIGRDWFDLWRSDVFPSDEVVIRGRVMPPPRYYSSIYELSDSAAYARLKRIRAAKSDALDNDSFRLPVKERVAAARLALHSRGMSDDV